MEDKTKKIVKSAIFITQSLVLAILYTAYLGKGELFQLNMYILPILFGAYYYALFGGIFLGTLCCGLTVWFSHNAGYGLGDPVVTTELIILSIVGIVAGLLQWENNKLKQTFLNASLTDRLTDLYNYGHFSVRIREEIARAERYKRAFSLAMIDIDLFKSYNDKYGHEAGNKVLVKLGEILKKNLRSSDIAFRYGGEEFAIIMPETNIQGAKITLERIRSFVHKTQIEINNKDTANITISAGITYHPFLEDVKHSVIERADKALYQAKEQGRNKVCLYE